jgi:hypothetical protein
MVSDNGCFRTPGLLAAAVAAVAIILALVWLITWWI